jgi:hypothetical protein
MTSTTVILILTIVAIAISLYYLYRNNATYKLRKLISDIDYEMTMQKIRNAKDEDDLCRISVNDGIYSKLPSYDDMLHSFKPLTLEQWLSPEDLQAVKEYEESLTK